MMGKAPLVSVIIPLYNAENYILETLESVANQTYTNIEIIIVDNASTDNSTMLAKQFCMSHPQARYYSTPVNSGGPAVPRNLGINVAKGRYIAFLDSDDVWSPDKLACQVNLMEDSSVNFTCTASSLIDENSVRIGKVAKQGTKKTRAYGIKSLLFRNTITTSSVVLSADLLGDRRFNESAEFVTVEDYHLWMTLIALPECQFQHIDRTLLDYRYMSASLGQKEGRYRFLARSLLASSMFLVQSKQYTLMPISLLSHLIRAVLLKLKGLDS
ncbi:glycosyltransferase family 2 protein [Neptuniibacter pectenicola]|uniref:glycosyltransferase family 2 protein n=1 Tax=Neptuniibacter pectenicola TaxID=1806669 RepID=UPI0009ED77A7|nr:glycosyltransferase family 2 protein [Neptuniibacter pectenicola]